MVCQVLSWRKIEQEEGWRVGGRGEFLIRVVMEGLTEKVKFVNNLRDEEPNHVDIQGNSGLG